MRATGSDAIEAGPQGGAAGACQPAGGRGSHSAIEEITILNCECEINVLMSCLLSAPISVILWCVCVLCPLLPFAF